MHYAHKIFTPRGFRIYVFICTEVENSVSLTYRRVIMSLQREELRQMLCSQVLCKQNVPFMSKQEDWVEAATARSYIFMISRKKF